MTSIETAISTARPQNSGRQPRRGSSHCTGSVEPTMPIEPVMSIQELVRSCTAGVNQRRKPVSGAIRQALTPRPHSTRATSSQPKLVASAKAPQPSTASATKRRITVRGPCRSSQVPRGSWISAKPRK